MITSLTKQREAILGLIEEYNERIRIFLNSKVDSKTNEKESVRIATLIGVVANLEELLK